MIAPWVFSIYHDVEGQLKMISVLSNVSGLRRAPISLPRPDSTIKLAGRDVRIEASGVCW